MHGGVYMRREAGWIICVVGLSPPYFQWAIQVARWLKFLKQDWFLPIFLQSNKKKKNLKKRHESEKVVQVSHMPNSVFISIFQNPFRTSPFKIMKLSELDHSRQWSSRINTTCSSNQGTHKIHSHSRHSLRFRRCDLSIGGIILAITLGNLFHLILQVSPINTLLQGGLCFNKFWWV